MGLDIYLRKGKRREVKDETISGVYNDICEQNLDEYFRKLKAWKASSYKNEESAVKGFFRLLEKYDGSSYCYSDYDGKKWIPKFKTLAEVDEIIRNIFKNGKKNCYSNSALYYRKVNLLYEFFSKKMDEDTQMAYVTKEDAERLVSLCEKALEDKGSAEEYLPTRSGFFFGSTDYDKWYFYDVRQVKRDFKKLLKKWEDDDVAIIYFSW